MPHSVPTFFERILEQNRDTGVLAYAGIGSRETPVWALQVMITVAMFLGERGWTLRSGGADGADAAFEEGARRVGGFREIYLPWKRFNDHPSNLCYPPEEAFPIAAKYHPAWESLSQGGEKLMARNVQQVLGRQLEWPSKFILCWTKGGKGSGGTGQALRIGADRHIPSFDFGHFGSAEELELPLTQFLRRFIDK